MESTIDPAAIPEPEPIPEPDPQPSEPEPIVTPQASIRQSQRLKEKHSVGISEHQDMLAEINFLASEIAFILAVQGRSMYQMQRTKL
jgi:hypothetical protein